MYKRQKYGGIFISDEVQTGFGRTGKTWGIEHYGVEPDMITVAKGIANGFPLAAVISTKEIADSLEKNTISTFGGNPVSCASANATIDIIKRDNLAENANNMGRRLMNGIKKIQKQYPKTIGDVRGKGLMVGIELVEDETIKDRAPDLDSTNRIMEETKKRGLLIGRGGLYGNSLRIAPALNIGSDEIDEALQIINDSFRVL